VRQDVLVEMVVCKLQAALLGAAGLESIESAFRKELEGRGEPTASTADKLRRQIATLDRDIDRAADNFLKAPPEVLGMMVEKLASMKRRRDALAGELRETRSADNPRDVELTVKAAMARLAQLRAELTKRHAGSAAASI
jgi:hypothetical protein